MNWWRLCLAASPLSALTSSYLQRRLSIITHTGCQAAPQAEPRGAPSLLSWGSSGHSGLEGDCRYDLTAYPQTPSTCPASSPALPLSLCFNICLRVPVFSQGSTGYLSEPWHSTECKHQRTWIPIPAGPHTGCGKRQVTKSPWAFHISPSEKWAWWKSVLMDSCKGSVTVCVTSTMRKNSVNERRQNKERREGEKEDGEEREKETEVQTQGFGRSGRAQNQRNTGSWSPGVLRERGSRGGFLS